MTIILRLMAIITNFINVISIGINKVIKYIFNNNDTSIQNNLNITSPMSLKDNKYNFKIMFYTKNKKYGAIKVNKSYEK